MFCYFWGKGNGWFHNASIGCVRQLFSSLQYSRFGFQAKGFANADSNARIRTGGSKEISGFYIVLGRDSAAVKGSTALSETVPYGFSQSYSLLCELFFLH